MADDYGVLYTDRELRKIESSVSRLYKQAADDIQKKMDDLTKDMAQTEAEYQKRVKEGKMTQRQFNRWKTEQLVLSEQAKMQYNQITEVLADTNTAANNIVNHGQILAFGENMNYAAYEIEKGFGTSFGFDVYDQRTVARLIRDEPNILPFKKLDKEKDMKWNFNNIRSQVTQGIIQGESIPKIAQRLSEVVPNRNEKQMVLHARTAMTSAQNAGRLERYKEAEGLGINLKKVWLATHDGRTRDTHLYLDGQAIFPDESFEVDGFEIDYPGDPHALPELTYNCRCTLVTELLDYPPRFSQRLSNSQSMTYTKWKEQNGEQ